MKKRIGSLCLCLALCLSLLPTVALAEEEPHYVAQMGDTKYESLQAALGEMEDATITLLDNVTEDEITSYSALTIDMAGYTITGAVEVYGALTLQNGTIVGNVKVDCPEEAFRMTAPADAEAAITGSLTLTQGAATVSGGKIGVKGSLQVDTDDAVSIFGSEKAVELRAAATGSTLYGAASEDDAATTVTFADDTYYVGDAVAKKLTNVGSGETPPAPTLSLTPETAEICAGQSARFTASYDGTDALHAYIQNNALDERIDAAVEPGTAEHEYIVTVPTTADLDAGVYTLFVHPVGNTLLNASAKITVQAAVAQDDAGNFYADIKSALKDAPDGSTVTVIAAKKQLPLSDGIYVDKTLTLDLNGHSLDGYALNIGGYNRSGKLTVKDSSGGSGAIGLAVRSGGDVEFRGSTATSCLQLDIYGGKVQFYGGNIRDISLHNDVSYADLLPEGYCYYNYSGSGSDLGSLVATEDVPNAVSMGRYLAVAACQHDFDSDGKCKLCGAQAVATLGNRFFYTDFQEGIHAAVEDPSRSFRLLQDITGDYTITAPRAFCITLADHAIHGTLTVKSGTVSFNSIKVVGENQFEYAGGTIDKVVVEGADAKLTSNNVGAVIGTLTVSDGATLKNVLARDGIGYKIHPTDGSSHYWYDSGSIPAGDTLQNVSIESLPINYAGMWINKVSSLTGTISKAAAGEELIFRRSCNTTGADVTFYLQPIDASGKNAGDLITWSGDEVTYEKINTNWYYTHRHSFAKPGIYWVWTVATKDNYTSQSSKRKLTITKSAQTGTPPAAIEGLVYNGKEQELITAGAADTAGLTMQYRLSKTDAYADKIPTGIVAGTYTVYYRIPEDADHLALEGSVTVTIAKATPEIAWNGYPHGKFFNGSAFAPPTDGEILIHDGKRVKLDLYDQTSFRWYPATKNADDSYTKTSETPLDGDPIDAGAYIIEATISATNNTNEAVCTQGLTVGKKSADAGETPVNASVDAYPAAAERSYTVDLAEVTQGVRHGGDLAINRYGVNYTSDRVQSATVVNGKLRITMKPLSDITPPAQGVATVTVGLSSKNYEQLPLIVTVNVIAKQEKSLAVTMESWTYGETAQNPMFVTPEDSTTQVTYATRDGGKLEARPTDAGDYTVTVRCETDTAVYTGTADFSILPKTVVIDTDQISQLNRDYDGKKTAVTGVKTTAGYSGTLEYTWYQGETALGSGADAGPVNAGSYTLRITAPAAPNYQAAEKDVSFTIRPRTLVCTILQPQSKIYGNPNPREYEYTFSNVVPGQVPKLTGLTRKVGEAVGQYPFITDKAMLVDNTETGFLAANYSLQFEGEAYFTIYKAKPVYTVPQNLTATYGDTLAQVRLPEGWTWQDSSQSVGSAGEHQFPATFTPSDTQNYETVKDISVTVTVNKAQFTAEVTDVSDYTYGNAPFTPGVSRNPEAGAVQYYYSTENSSRNGTLWTSETRLDAGGYYLYAVIGATENYEAFTTAPAAFTVEPRSLTATGITVQSKTYDGTVSATVKDRGSLAGVVSGDDVSLTIAAAFMEKDAGADRPVDLTLGLQGAAAKNYTLDRESSQTRALASIHSREVTIQDVEILEKTYTGSSTALVTGVRFAGLVDGEQLTRTDYTVQSAEFNSANVQDAREVVVKLMLLYTPVGKNYRFADGYTTQFTKTGVYIAKAPGEISAPEGKTGQVYTGQTQALLESAATSTTGEVRYKLGEDGVYSAALPTATQAGTYTVYYKSLGDGNHEDTAEASVTVTIARQEVAVPAKDDTAFTYTGEEQTYSIAENANYSVTGNIQKNAGEYTVTVALLDAKNFIWSDGTDDAKSYDFTIARQAVAVPAKDDTVFTYTGEEQTYQIAENANYSVTGNTQKNAGKYTVTVELRDAKNFVWSDGTDEVKGYDFTLAPAPVTITVKDKRSHVNGTAPDLSKPERDVDYTVEGLLSEDALLTAPRLSYDPAAPDMTQPGSAKILADGADAGGNYAITYVPGTLSIIRRSSGGGGGGTVTYPVVIPEQSENGTVTAQPKEAAKGSTVTITVTPDSGYTLDDLVVTDKNGEKLPLTDKGNGDYSFVMPDGKVEVKASFVKQREDKDFADVSQDDYYYDAVRWAADKGVTSGVGDGLFAPDAACTRAQIVTFLWRTAGSPEPGSLRSFSDVPADAYYAKAVAWAVEKGITIGTDATHFSPEETCTRAQSVTFLYRANGQPAAGAASFRDVPADAYYAKAVAWAAEKGITRGVAEGLFGPEETCTRAQIVSFLYRSMQ